MRDRRDKRSGPEPGPEPGPKPGPEGGREPSAGELEALEALLADWAFAAAVPASEMPERFEDLAAWQEEALLQDDLSEELPLLAAPRALDLRVAAAVGLPGLSPAVASGASSGGAGDSRRRRSVYAAALAAGLLALLHLGVGAGSGSAGTTSERSPRLVLVEVDRPHTLFADTVALSAYIGGAKLDARSTMLPRPGLRPRPRGPEAGGR